MGFIRNKNKKKPDNKRNIEEDKNINNETPKEEDIVTETSHNEKNTGDKPIDGEDEQAGIEDTPADIEDESTDTEYKPENSEEETIEEKDNLEISGNNGENSYVDNNDDNTDKGNNVIEDSGEEELPEPGEDITDKSSTELSCPEGTAQQDKALEVIPKKGRLKRRKRAKKDRKEKKVLPSIFRKKYTKSGLKRKILKKIYIPKDREYIKSLFLQEESSNPKKPGKFYIPEELHYDPRDLRKIKSIGRQIKKQKGRIKFIPLIAVGAFITAIFIFVISMKDVYIGRGIRSFCEYQFEGKCDMAQVHLDLLDTSFTIKGFEVADKNSPMRNAFSFDSLIIDFDLLPLLRGKVIAEELSIHGMNSGTKRSYDGSLPAKQLAKIRAEKEEKAKKAQEKKEKIKTALNSATNKVKNNVKESIIDIFNTFNPLLIIDSCYSKFETPGVAKNIQDEAIVLIDKWGKTPEVVKTHIGNVKTSAEDIINFDYNSILNDPKKIKDMLENFDTAFKTLEEVKVETENIIGEIEKDTTTVNDLLVDVKDSIEHDIGVGKDKIDELKSFRLPSGQEFLASTIDIYGYELLGKYYPMLIKGINYLISLKGKQFPKKEDIEKKDTGLKRAEGRDISFVTDYNPKFWIKKMAASGFNMEAQITNISNNMDITNKPSEVLFKLYHKDIVFGGKVVVDIRTKTEAPLVYLEYTCDGTSFAHKDGIPGVPQISSNADYLCNAKIYDDRPFVMTSVGSLYNLSLSTPYFEPSYVHEIYNSILGRFDSAEVKIELIIDGLNDMALNAYTDLDDKIAQALKDEINLRLREIKEAIEAAVEEKIQLFMEKAMVYVDKVREIENKIREFVQQIYELEDRLLAKKAEIESKVEALQEHIENKIIETGEKVQEGLQQEADRIKDKIEQDVETAKKKSEEKAEQIEESIKQGVEDAAKDMFDNLLGGVKLPF